MSTVKPNVCTAGIKRGCPINAGTAVVSSAKNAAVM